MPKKVRDVEVLGQYLRQVLDRADHHAGEVDAVVLTIAGAVLWRKDSAPIEVREQDGEMKNVIWVQISGRRYALSYKHEAQAVEVRDRSTHGRVVASFSNRTSPAEIKKFFASL